MLEHRVCASILHWLGRCLVTLDRKKPVWHLENYPINVKCLRIGYEQAFYIDWVNYHIENYPNEFWKLPNQGKMLAHTQCASILHWLGSFQRQKKCCIYFYIDWAVLKYCPINVKCLRINYLLCLLRFIISKPTP